MEKADQGLINTFLKNAYQKYGRRYAFTFNVYPYFDPGVHLNPGSTDQCSLDLPRVICWEGSTCLGPNIMAAARRQISRMTGRLDDLFWIGEIGWSSPKASALGTAMAECEQFSSLDTFKTFYNGFLQWNLDVPGSLPGPDHAFYFTLRDALNFGKQEHFGLITSCESLACKIAKPDFRGEICPLASLQQGLSWQAWGFVGLGVLLAVCTGLTCLFVRSPKVQKHFDRPQRIAKRRLVQAAQAPSERLWVGPMGTPHRRERLARSAAMARAARGLLALLVSLTEVMGSERIVSLTEATFAETLRKSQMALVAFVTPWCMACRLLMPELERLEEALAETSVLVAQCDVSREARLAQIYSAWRTPLAPWSGVGIWP
ncbi:unnamed protein product [Effrenium voratum]|uniref:Thioredoxin domain-containing protein n=1 Tax=Effrenium voratum TaxID=2562239 RepID=A0AA36HY33_9DINO|nr:unnamed protein product [Effrenium voratum]